eukprot:Platyproteum_vivax@DN7050_c0_g1_i1.p1
MAVLPLCPHLVAGLVVMMALDMSSHWYHMYTSVLMGRTSHKKIPASKPLLKMYYEVTGVMFVMHVSTEVFLLALYLYYRWLPSPVSTYILWVVYGSLPGTLAKMVVHINQLVDSSCELAELDVKTE